MMKTNVALAMGVGVVLKLAVLAMLVSHARAHAADDADVVPLLKAADRYRTSSEDMQVETVVSTLTADGQVDKERRYTVFVQAGHKSLVLMKSPAEAGQKVLMLGDDYSLLMPGSQRALRITPMQKLLGDASTGDISTMSWSQDYAGVVVGEEHCDVAGAQRACVHLHLHATRPGVSYQRIELWLGQSRHEPLKAELYVQSDKLAKVASFVFEQASAPTQVREMVLEDRLASHRVTRVRYESQTPRRVPESWLNPMFLVRNPVLE